MTINDKMIAKFQFSELTIMNYQLGNTKSCDFKKMYPIGFEPTTKLHHRDQNGQLPQKKS